MVLLGVISIFIISILMGVPVAFALLLSSLIPLLVDPIISLNLISSIFFQTLRNFTLLAIPLYIFCGILFNDGGVTNDIIFISKVLVGKVRGNLAHVNVVTSILFAGISGSSIADVTSLGAILIPAMKKRGYSAEFSAALTAASATIGNIIPPSILMIIYGAIAQISIAALFAAGFIPGIFIGLVQMIYSYFYVIRHDIDKIDKKNEEIYSFPMIKQALIKSISPLSIFIIVIGGILGGVFTPTEAGAVAVFWILFLLITFFKKRDITMYLRCAKKAAIFSGITFFLIMSATLFSWILSYYEVLNPLVEIVKTRANISGTFFLIIITAIYIVLGTFMEAASILLIIVPLVLPIVDTLHINPIVFGLISVMATRVGSITPPYGLCSLMAAKIAGTNILKMGKYIVIFLVLYILVILVLILFPGIILFLPKLLLPAYLLS